MIRPYSCFSRHPAYIILALLYKKKASFVYRQKALFSTMRPADAEADVPIGVGPRSVHWGKEAFAGPGAAFLSSLPEGSHGNRPSG